MREGRPAEGGDHRYGRQLGDLLECAAGDLEFIWLDVVAAEVGPYLEFASQLLVDAVVSRLERSLAVIARGTSRSGIHSVTTQDVYPFSRRKYLYLLVGVEVEQILIPGNNVLSITLECTF